MNKLNGVDGCRIFLCHFTNLMTRHSKLHSCFISSCLRSWLENDTSCPTCRQSLADDLQPESDPDNERQPRGMAAFMMGHGIRRFDNNN
jgi:hypothetical protein